MSQLKHDYRAAIPFAPGMTVLPCPSIGFSGDIETNNPLLLSGAGETWLIDTASPGLASLRLLREQMAGQGLSPKDLTGLVISHADYDHVGLLWYLRSINPDLKVYIHEKERERLRRMDLFPGECPENVAPGFEVPRLDPDSLTTVGEGDVLRLAGREWTVMVPGLHTPGCLVFHQPESRILHVTDVLFHYLDLNLPLVLEDPAPLLAGEDPSALPQELVRSYLTPLVSWLRRWLELDLEHVLFGHNHCLKRGAVPYLRGLVDIYGPSVGG